MGVQEISGPLLLALSPRLIYKNHLLNIVINPYPAINVKYCSDYVLYVNQQSIIETENRKTRLCKINDGFKMLQINQNHFKKKNGVKKAQKKKKTPKKKKKKKKKK